MQKKHAKKKKKQITITNFQKRIFNLVSKIPKGKTLSYGYIARKLNTSPRAVGQALHKNPCPVKIPCHRVVMANNSLGGYSQGIEKKIRLLKKEGVKIRNGKVISKAARKP